MDKVLEDVKAGAAHLRHTNVEHDASKPAIEPGTQLGHFDKQALLEGIEKGVPLKHVTVEHDASAPVIDANAHVGENHHAELMEEVKHAAVVREIKSGHAADHLKHVE